MARNKMMELRQLTTKLLVWDTCPTLELGLVIRLSNLITEIGETAAAMELTTIDDEVLDHLIKKGGDSYNWLIKNHPFLEWMKEKASEME